MTSGKWPSRPTISSADRALIEQAMRRGASRRELLGLLAAGGASLAMGGAILGSATDALAQAPRKGGRIKVAGSAISPQDTVDPAKQSYSVDYARCAMFYNGLTSLDGSLTPQPELAESFTSDKAKVWTFKLRKGVTFHDGKPLTAADVVYSLNRHKDKATGSRANALAVQMEEIKAVGTDTVVITLTSPNADLPVILGTWHFLIIKEGTTEFKTAIGTGPYKVKEFTPGIRTIGVRNENYWKPGKPYLDEIELIGIPDETARVNAMISGDVQLIAGINPRSIRLIEGSPGFKVFETKAGYYTDLIMRQDIDPVKNPDFQMAVKHLQNREEIRSAVFRNFAVVGNDQPIDPSNRYYCKEIAQRPFDPDKAKFPFQKSGIGNTALPLYASTAAPGSIEMGVQLQEAAQKIGMNIDLRKVPPEGYWSNIWIKQPFAYGAINPRPSADILLTLFFKHDAAWNESKWKNDKFEGLLIAARSESDEAKRKQHYCDIQAIIKDNCGLGIPVFITLLDAHSEKLRGLSPIPLGNLMGNAFAEHIWLAA
ncbi:MAG TPA: ABC transporter substrate-binding protein [Hyphomicrobiaceae bacterium]|nr:ABC transporter substrate-binding protein [Hyphomicrobiaceae bacterium]